jgi:GNAT superfamily N-acetyltransferase
MREEVSPVPDESLRISCDPREMDVALIHAFLSEQSYWSQGVPLDTVRRAIDNSLCFGAFAGHAQVGFARVVTDRATFAYLADVFVLPTHRARGVGKALMTAVLAHPDLQGLRRFMLATRDAHALYAQFGFTPPVRPHTLMERFEPDIYQRASAQ